MLVYGYVKDHHYTNDGTLEIQVRIPSIHGAYSQLEYRGKPIKNYVLDADLPWYPSILLPHDPQLGEVVALLSTNDKSSDFFVIGLTGGQFNSVNNNIGE